MAVLHDLPPEILALILRDTDSPGDLHSLIAASPVCLAVFVTTRNQILSSILKNAITPGSIRHALAAIAAPPPVLGAADSRKRASPDVNLVTSLIDSYFSAEPVDFPRDTAGIMSLWRLYCQVSRFADEYAHRAFQLLKLEASAETAEPTRAGVFDAQKPTPLSPMERTRFQRAFFRYELYCRLFPPASEPYGGTITAEEQLALFLNRMSPWEVEEMSCVHNYLIYLVKGFIEDMESQIMEAVLNSPGALILKPGEAPQPHSSIFSGTSGQYDSTGNERMVTFDDLQLRNLSLYGNSRCEESSFMNKIASYGLEFISKLTRAERVERKDIIRQEDPFAREALPQALVYTRRGNFIRGARYVDFQRGDDASWANLGYRIRRAFDSRPHVLFAVTSFEESLYEPIREQGYVFWDRGRLESPVIRRSIAKAAKMSLSDSEPGPWAGRKSIEKRLHGVQIRWSEMQRIIREYSHKTEAEL